MIFLTDGKLIRLLGQLLSKLFLSIQKSIILQAIISRTLDFFSDENVYFPLQYENVLNWVLC